MMKIRSLSSAVVTVLAALSACAALADDAGKPAATVAPAWVAIWQQAYKGDVGQFNPEQMSAILAADRISGDVYLVSWDIGVRKSSDGGKSFIRVDGQKITGPGCGPITSYSVVASPDGGKIAVFNMWNTKGPSGYTLDGGATWETFADCGRDWDFGTIDFDSKLVIGARHEDDGLHVSTDGGKTWTRLAKSRGGITGLGAVGETLLAASNGGIERSEDDGATWNKVSDVGAVGVIVKFKGKLWALSSASHKCLMISSDEGKTWSPLGAALPEPPVIGPMFGKDENHIVVAAGRGFYESTDGAKTWKLAVPMPEDYSIGGACGAAFDPIHDVFYVTNWQKSAMKFARSSPPDYVAVKPAELDAKAAATASPPLAFQPVGGKGLRCFVNQSQDLSGDYFYVSGEDGIIILKRDATTGQLKFIKQIDEQRSGGFILRAAGGHLYGVTPHDGYHRMTWHGLAWYDIDPATGEPTRKGVVDCPASRQMIVGPGEKDLYFKTCGKEDKVLWYRIGDAGKPQKAGEVWGKGIGTSSHITIPGIFQISPDGKNLYAVSAKGYAIAVVTRKADGSIEYKTSVDLSPLIANDAENYRYQWVSLGISPDGNWVYASVRNGAPHDNVYGIYKRDPASGALTLSEKFGGLEDPLANMKGWAMAFAAAPATGYLGSAIGPAIQFKYDPATGRLSTPVALMPTLRFGSSAITVDRARNILYTGGGTFGITYDGLDQIEIGKR